MGSIFWLIWLFCTFMVLKYLFKSFRTLRVSNQYNRTSTQLLSNMENLRATTPFDPEGFERFRATTIQFDQNHDQWRAALDEIKELLDKSNKWIIAMWVFLVLSIVF